MAQDQSIPELFSLPTLDWHAVELPAIWSGLRAGSEGLSEQDAAFRLEMLGANVLPETAGPGRLKRFLRQFHNVLIYILLASGAISAALGHWVDSAVIIAVTVINAVIGYLQEGKAERALEAIRQMLPRQATVYRDGRVQLVPAEQLVPGDVVMLQSGDRVPADVRLFSVNELALDESMLTGESVPVAKAVSAVESSAAVADRSCMGYSGCWVTAGRGLGVVVATGANTEVGRISRLLGEVTPLVTPLLRNMALFGRKLTAAIVVIALMTFAIGFLGRGYGAEDMLMAAVGIAVAAIPEGLPPTLTITLAIGVLRMAHRSAIIRQLPAVETLGAVTVICTDKTGTLTRNEMTVSRVATADGCYEVTGVGYAPHGAFLVAGEAVETTAQLGLLELARAGLLCNDAALHQGDQGWHVTGDPTEGALITLGYKAGLDPQGVSQAFSRCDTLPFDSMRGFMATRHTRPGGDGVIYLKGAPEQVLARCDRQFVSGRLESLDVAYWQHLAHELASGGLRLLALASKETVVTADPLQEAEVAGGLVLLGLVGMIDPPRPEAVAAVARCQSAGIRVKMITGDHLVTARAIATQIGIADGHALTGRDIEQMDETQLARAVVETDVFARASPEHKLRLVQALQRAGHVVAMTGDGVNDAPALKRADVGIAMGHKGTEVAKEAARMVLADDNFATIAHAVEEGRTVYDNLTKCILFILPTSAGQALALIAAIVFDQMLPITPVQILWINMVTAVTLALALAFEPPEQDVMRRPPRAPTATLLTPLLAWRVLGVSLLMTTASFGMFLYLVGHGADLAFARTMAVNVLVMAEIAYLFNSRFLSASVFSRAGLGGNRYVLLSVLLMLALQCAFTYLPPLQFLFGSVALAPGHWLAILAVGGALLVLVELEKWVVRRWLPA